MASKLLQIFIGYDARETVAYHVLAHSILTRTSRPVSITPLAKHQLRRVHTRDSASASTDFAFTRFLVPYLCDYNGYAVFMDCDMLVRCDLALDLWLHVLAYPNKAVWCCQHDYTPKRTTKFLGNKQVTYHRKNWSSLIVFDAARCEKLTPDYVNTATGLDLHQFTWLDDDAIGALPLTFNHLVGEYPYDPDAKIIHYTNGGPWFDECRESEYAIDWFAERDRMLTCAQVIA